MPESKAERKARVKAAKKAKLETNRGAKKDERAAHEDAECAAHAANAAIKVYVDAAADVLIRPLVEAAIEGALEDAVGLAPAPAPAPAPDPPEWKVGDVVVCDLRLPVARRELGEAQDLLDIARGLLAEAEAAEKELPGDRDTVQALYKAQNELPDVEEAVEELENRVHGLLVAGLSAVDGGLVIVGTVRGIVLSDEAKASQLYWDTLASEAEVPEGAAPDEAPAGEADAAAAQEAAADITAAVVAAQDDSTDGEDEDGAAATEDGAAAAEIADADDDDDDDDNESSDDDDAAAPAPAAEAEAETASYLGSASCYIIERKNGHYVVMPFEWCEKFRPVDAEEPDVSRYDPFLIETTAFDELPVNELQVGVVRAHSLAIRDTRKFWQAKTTVESSDPRVVISLKGRPDVRLESTVREKTLSPAWAESFNLELMEDEVREDPTLTIRVEDYDGTLSKPQSMGVCEIPLASLKHGRSRGWYELTKETNTKGVVSGEIELVLRWRHVEARVFRPFLNLKDDLTKCPNELVIGVGRGRGLPIMDRSMFSKGGSSDPRIVMWIEGVDEPLTSSTKKKSLDPCWREVFRLEVPSTLEAPLLHIKCEDWDLVGRPDFMGAVDVPLIDYRIQLGFTSIDHRRVTRSWLPLGARSAKTEPQGEVEIQLWMRYSKELDFDPFMDRNFHKLEKPNELQIGLIRGRDLAAKDGTLFTQATSDPQVIFSIKGTELIRRSTYKIKSLAPRWNEIYDMPFEEGMTEEEVPTLLCTCEDYDDFSSNDFMGFLEFEIAKFRHRRYRDWYDLQPDPKRPKELVSGKLEIVLRWWHNPALAWEPFLDAHDEDEEPNELLVALVQGRDLAPRDSAGVLGFKPVTSDPRVRFRIIDTDERAQSTHKAKTLAPRWNEEFGLYCVPGELPVLKVICEDYDRWSSADSMGLVEVDVSAIKTLLAEPRSRHRAWFQLQTDPSCPKDPVSGALELVLRWRHNPALHFAPFSEYEELEEYLENPPNELRVCLIRGKGLAPRERSKKRDDIGSATPRCVFTYAGSDLCVQSEPREATLSPTWKQELILDVEEFQKSIEGPQLSVKIESNGASMGVFEIPLKHASHQLYRAWFAVRPDGPLEVTGRVEVACYWGYNPEKAYEPFEEEVDEHPTKVRNELLLSVVRARDVQPKKKGVFGSSLNPAVRLRVPGTDVEVVTTKRKSRHPIYKEEFCQEYEASDEKKPGLMEVVVENGSRVLGIGILPLSGVRREFRLRQWLTLKDPETREAVGAICIIACWRHNPALVFDPFGGPIKYKGRLQNELQISVYRCRCLERPGSDGFPSPSVQITLGDKAAVQTDKKKNTSAPNFRANFAFNVEKGDPVDCDITVRDHKSSIGGPKILGVVKLRDLTNGLSNRLPFRKWYALEDVDNSNAERPLVDPPRAPGEEALSEAAPLGRVQLLFRWHHNPAQEPQLLGTLKDTPSKDANELLVLVGRARDLRPSSEEIPSQERVKEGLFSSSTGEGKMRAFLRASYLVDEETVQMCTALKGGTYGPRWFQLLRIGLDEHAVDTREVSEMAIEVRDRLRKGGDDVQPLLGAITLDLVKALAVRRAGQELEAPDWRWHTLTKPAVEAKVLGFNEEPPPPEPDASLKLAFMFRHDPRWAPEYYTAPDPFPAEEPNELHICIVAARNVGKRPDLLVDDTSPPGSAAPSLAGGSQRASSLGGSQQASRASTREGSLRAAAPGAAPVADESQQTLAVPTPGETRLATDVVPGVAPALPSCWVRVTTKMSQEVLRTEVRALTRRPAYHAEFKLDLPEVDEVAADASLVIEVFDRQLVRGARLLEEKDVCLGLITVPVVPLLDKVVRRRWMALDAPHLKPTRKGGRDGDVPGWARLKDVLHEKDIAPLGLVDMCLRLETSAARAAQMASPAGRIARACRRFRLEEGVEADLNLRRSKVSVKNCTLLAAIVDPQTARDALPIIRAPLLMEVDLRTCSLDGEKLARLALALPFNDTLHSLDLSGNDFSDGVRSKAVALRSTKAAVTQNVALNDAYDFRAAFGSTRAHEAQSAPALVASDAYTIQDHMDALPANVGLKVLGEALKTNAGLTSLNLSESHVEAGGLAALSAGLRRNASLTELKLARNEVCNVSVQGWGAHSSCGVTALGEALGVNATLQKLDLSRNQLCGVTAPWCAGTRVTFAPGALLALRRPLASNAALRELNLTDNGVLEAGGRPLIRDLSGARHRAGGDFRLLERIGKATRPYCILRRAGYFKEVAAAARGASAY